MKWKYNRMTKTYESDNFLIIKKIAWWDEWFNVIRKTDNIKIKTGIKKLSQAKNLCEILT
jgi:hypothetical protein